MLNHDSNGSAKIYQFPAGGRPGRSSARFNRDTGTNVSAVRVNEIVCSDSWYHQAAIDESKAARDH